MLTSDLAPSRLCEISIENTSYAILIPRWPLPGLVNWCPLVWSRHCNSLENRVTVDKNSGAFIYGYPIFSLNCSGLTRMWRSHDSSPSNNHQGICPMWAYFYHHRALFHDTETSCWPHSRRRGHTDCSTQLTHSFVPKSFFLWLYYQYFQGHIFKAIFPNVKSNWIPFKHCFQHRGPFNDKSELM